MTAAGLARIGRALGDPRRAAMVVALLDGRRWRVGELAEVAGVGVPTASDHVACLAESGVVTVTHEGRCTYVTIASADVAEAVELVSALAGTDAGAGAAHPRSSYRQVAERRRLHQARTCYDHLAGSLGVAVHDGLLARGALSDRGGLAVPPTAQRWWERELGIDLGQLRAARRPLARECLDWTERRPHLAGSLGAALCRTAFERHWVRRPDRTRRLLVTEEGAAALDELLGVRYAETSDSWSAN